MRILAGVELSLLLALREMLATQSVTVAARRLDTTQPNLSRLLARARVLFADPLLVPVGRRMERTPRARELQPRLEQALDSMRRLLSPAPLPGDEPRVVHVAASDYALKVVLEPWLQRLRREAPGVVVRVQPVGADSIDPLARGEIDLAIAPRLPLEGIEQFVLRKVLDDRLVCVVRRKHPRVRGELTLSGYLDLAHVMVSSGRPTPSNVQVALHRLGKTRQVALTVPSFLAALALVQASDLAAALPERLVRAMGAPVTCYPLPFRIDPISLHLAWHPRRSTDPSHRWLRDGILAAQS
ncbi:MAG: LysR family transcriptional regulator [Myxococcales bacterium]